MIHIDILYLVDRLEAAINKGLAVPFSAKRLIDEDECLDIIDQMRVAIPEEIRQARRVTQEKERVLAQAKEEAERVVALAQDQVSHLADQSEVVRLAVERAGQIQRQAELEAQSTREGADQYAQQVLAELQQRLDELSGQVAALQQQVNNGLGLLSKGRELPKTAAPPPPPLRPREPVAP